MKSSFILPLKRIVAFGIDYIAIAAYCAVLFFLSFQLNSVFPYFEWLSHPVRAQAAGFITLTIPVFLYFSLSEKSSWKGTIGKRLLNIQVVTSENEKAPFHCLAIRNGVKFLPWEIAHGAVHWSFHYTDQGSAIPAILFLVNGTALILAFTYVLMIFVNRENRSLYEIVSGTRVILTNTLNFHGGRWSNAEEDTIEIVPYNPEWPLYFNQEKELLLSVLPHDLVIEIEHFGSTSIPGSAAKPVIDILLICSGRRQWERFIEPIKSLGYVFWTENPRKDRMFFVKGMPPYGKQRTHHVHLMDRETAKDRLLFRDYMRNHPEEMRKYEELKKSLMKQYKTDRETYTEGKRKYIKNVLNLIRQ
jgi:GrpB-like predicted nucleotidyltransferase (UPF0157 family)/uncharacterized RDD family membrane protein YckC